MLNRLHTPSNIIHFVAGSSHLDLTKKKEIDDKSINNIFLGESTDVVEALKVIPRHRFHEEITTPEKLYQKVSFEFSSTCLDLCIGCIL